MEKKPFTRFEVGKLFPGPVPHREGAIMELWEIGLVVVIQFPGLRSDEVSAFHMRYYSLITGLGGAVIYGSRSKYHPPQNPEICLTDRGGVMCWHFNCLGGLHRAHCKIEKDESDFSLHAYDLFGKPKIGQFLRLKK
jgi:hypothetical protein